MWYLPVIVLVVIAVVLVLIVSLMRRGGTDRPGRSPVAGSD